MLKIPVREETSIWNNCVCLVKFAKLLVRSLINVIRTSFWCAVAVFLRRVFCGLWSYFTSVFQSFPPATPFHSASYFSLELSFQVQFCGENWSVICRLTRLCGITATTEICFHLQPCCCETVGRYICVFTVIVGHALYRQQCILSFIRWWIDLRCNPDVDESDGTCCQKRSVTSNTNYQLIHYSFTRTGRRLLL